MSALRDSIGRRLAEIFAEHHGWDIEDAIKTIGGDTLRHQADECIRQMEWARHDIAKAAAALDARLPQDFDRYSNLTYSDTSRSAVEDALRVRSLLGGPLTPAPDDWKPE